MWRTCNRFVLALLLLSDIVVVADTPQPRIRLGRFVSQLEVGPGCDMSGKHLKGSEFVGQDLCRVRFDGCDLAGVLFHDCDLRTASFRDCSLKDCRINDCKLDDADFSGAIVNKLEVRVTGLSPKQFTSTKSYLTKKLSWCEIPGSAKGNQTAYDFRNADLRGAKLYHGDFRLAKFEGATLYETEFVNIDLLFDQLKVTENFQRRGLRGHKLKGVRFEGVVDFTSLNLADASIAVRLETAKYDDADISRTRLRACIDRSQLESTRNFNNGDLTGISFWDADFSAVDFSGKNLTGTQFIETDLAGANFNDAVITGVRFRGTVGLTAKQVKSTWNYRHQQMTGIQLPSNIASATGILRSGESGDATAVTIEGQIVVNGRPLEHGIVMFTDGVAKFEDNLKMDGRYKVMSALLVPGRNYTVIVKSDRVQIPARYNARSMLSFIPSGGVNNSDFSLNLRKRD